MVEPSENAPSENECPVCLEPILESEATTTTNCGHMYHFTCFMRAFQDSDNCSVCRADLFPERNSERRDRNEEEDEEEELVELELDDLDDDIVNQIRSHIRDHLESQLGNTTTSEYRRRRSINDIFKACRDGNQSTVVSILEGNPDLKYSRDLHLNSILHSSVLSGNENLVRYLVNDISLPIDCYNIHRLSPIHFCVLTKNPRILRILLNCGGNVDFPNGSGETPLMIACKQRNSIDCQILLDNNANVNIFDMNGNTPLHFAVNGRSNSCVRNILSSDKTDQNAANYFNNTPLHLACMNESTSIVRILLSGCSDPELKNNAGHKPIDLIPSENSRLRALLRENSA